MTNGLNHTVDTPKIPFLFIQNSLAPGGMEFALVNSTQPSKHWLPVWKRELWVAAQQMQQARGLATGPSESGPGALVQAAGWPAPRRAQPARWQRHVGAAVAAGEGPGLAPESGSWVFRGPPPLRRDCQAAGSQQFHGVDGDGRPRNRYRAGAAAPPASSRRSLKNALPPRPSPLPPSVSWRPGAQSFNIFGVQCPS